MGADTISFHYLPPLLLQIPRYIITLHELLAHTPHDHVERKSLQNARQQLEDLSRLMHDEVSETENLRKNLAVERMIEGCDILLDVNQVFVRQGSCLRCGFRIPVSVTDNFRSYFQEASCKYLLARGGFDPAWPLSRVNGRWCDNVSCSPIT